MFTASLCQFIQNTKFDDLPDQVVTAAKRAFLDFIGVSMAGSQEPSGQIVNEMVKESRSSPQATVIGHRYRTSPAQAALANGSFGHVLDFDDCLDMPECGLGHPSTSIIPALMAYGEKLEASGRDMILSYCLGLEAYAKIGLIVRDAFRNGQNWEWTGILGTMGAAAAMAKLLKLNVHQSNMCIGIASSLAAGIIRNFGSMAGHYHAGNASRAGIESAMLANAGFTSFENAIEAPHGFYNTLTGDAETLRKEIAIENANLLGNPWNLLSPGLMFKAFPCAHISHFGVTAARVMNEDYEFSWKEITKIDFIIPESINKVVWYPDPKTGIQAKFSLGYCLCRTLINGKVFIDDFADESIQEKNTRDLMAKISWHVEKQDLKHNPFGYQKVILTLSDSKTIEQKVDYAKGEPKNPQSDEEFTGKYLDCAAYANYSPEAAKDIMNAVLDLENINNVATIGELLMC